MSDKKFLLIFVVSIILFTANLGGISIYILDEAKNSTAAREMLEGNHVVPTFNYELRTDKPPLHYYFMMAAYSLLGVTAFSARLFSALCGIVLVSGTYWFTKRFVHRDAAFWSAIVLLSALQVVVQFHMAVPDPYLILFFTFAMFCGFAYYKEKKRYWIYLAYAFISLAVLAKGPVALILAFFPWLLFLVIQKQFSFNTLRTYRVIEGLVIMTVIIAPWYFAVHFLSDGAWTEGFFFKHNLDRFTAPMEGHGGNFLLVPVYLIAGLFPFSLFAIQALRHFWKNRSHEFLLLSALTVFVVVVFFSISSTKLPGYTAPAFPFFAILLGLFIAQHVHSGQRSFSLVFWVLFIVGLIISVAVYIVLEDVMRMPHLKDLAFWFIPLPVGALIALALFYRKQSQYALLSIAISWMVTTLAFFYIVFPAVDRMNPVSRALTLIKPSDQVYYYERFNPAFAFYLKKKIMPVQEPPNSQRPVVVLTMQRDSITPVPFQGTYEVIHAAREFFEPNFSFVLYRNDKGAPISYSKP